MNNPEKPQYDHNDIEKKWQNTWEEQGVYKTLDNSAKPKQYILDMFPYPSGVGLHVGHPRGYIASDVFSRYRRMQGFNVLHPMGFDSFGLPAEQYAIKTGNHPGPHTEELVAHYKTQLSNIGFSYDWSREVATHRPEYYKWTQWIFLQLYNSWYNTTTNMAEPIESCIQKLSLEDPNWNTYTKKEQQDILMQYRIAYEGYAEVNWCPELGTVLANDEIIAALDGSMVSERGEYPVVRKSMRQWFMRISSFADRLLDGLDTIDWPHSIKEIQRNWIGKSEGSEIDFKVTDSARQDLAEVSVFTTRADTLFGVTYVVLAPEHLLIEKLISSIKNWDEVQSYIAQVKATSEDDRINDKNEKTGIVLEGVYATNPANGHQVPVWIANYVLASYGTGAVMAVPAHDERDFEFARKYDLPITIVISPDGINENPELPFLDDGFLFKSKAFSQMPSQNARMEIGKKNKMVVKYRMRDAIFARQRYWGEPIPLRHTEDGLIEALAESELPLELPDLVDFAPAGDGNSALSKSPEWMTKGYETNTMPGWAGSSWYFLRYMDPKNAEAFASRSALEYWGQVDMYIGGAEHATGHLLYSRFWNIALYDLGYVPHVEPFKALRNQGMIAGPDGRKMSKRWGNVINPDDVVAQLGADTLRLYESFMGPFDSHLPWSINGIVGTRRFLEKVWRIYQNTDFATSESSAALHTLVHKTIKKISEDIEGFKFNTAVSALMILVNKIEEEKTVSLTDYKTLLQLLAPFAPHITEEIWYALGNTSSIHLETWPSYDPAKIVDEKVTLAIQINGKVRGTIEVPHGTSKEDVERLALESEKVQNYLAGNAPKKVIVVQGRVVNIVV